MQDLVISALVTLFVVIDPIGLMPIFMSVAKPLSVAARRSAAVRAAIIAGFVLTLFAIGGHRFLDLIGISLPAFRIAGGIFLFAIAFEMVFARREQRKSSEADRAIEKDHPQDIAAFPMAVPLMAGPGGITAAMLLAERAKGDLAAMSAVVGVIWLVVAVSAVVLMASIPLDRLLGDTVRNVVSRLLGVILAALAVQFVIDGITEAMSLYGPAG